jgi:hypothetical protein
MPFLFFRKSSFVSPFFVVSWKQAKIFGRFQETYKENSIKTYTLLFGCQ